MLRRCTYNGDAGGFFMPTALGVIPARFASSRFPGKPLVPLSNGRSLLETVWLRALEAQGLDRIIVATDDDRIEAECRRIGAECMRTSSDHPSGTDRVAETVERLERSWDVILNIQGDEPFVTSAALTRLIDVFSEGLPPSMATLCEPLVEESDLLDPNVVKVVRDAAGRALYFSRAGIPYPAAHGANHGDVKRDSPLWLRHQGLYAYTPDCLEKLTTLPPSPLELCERLEQLRALEAGMEIRVIDSDFHSLGVDTPEDLQRVNRILEETSHAS
jgi:3-deoxy-manno-octulosonate cytidylyltransferase (CMP-KDO synthetase)